MRKPRIRTGAMESAHKKVSYAIEHGRLERAPCMICGDERRVQAHHDNYARPLDVVWLCQRHHLERHRSLPPTKALGATAPNPKPLTGFNWKTRERWLVHGTITGYRQHNCRCDECRAAKLEEGRRTRLRKKLQASQ